MGLEMADAACPVSLRAHQYNAYSLRRVMLSQGKRHFGGAALCRGVAWGTAVEWEGAEGNRGAAPLLPGFCWALCLLYASCLSLPGRSAVQRGWEQGAPALDSPARGSAMLAPALGSSWRILHSFDLQGRQRAQHCAGQQHGMAMGFSMC